MRANVEDYEEDYEEEEASPKESASKSGKRPRLLHSAVAESPCKGEFSVKKEAIEEQQVPAARELREIAKQLMARASQVMDAAQEKEKQYKKMLHTINREKKRKKVERATRKRKIQAYAERLDKIPLSG